MSDIARPGCGIDRERFAMRGAWRGRDRCPGSWLRPGGPIALGVAFRRHLIQQLAAAAVASMRRWPTFAASVSADHDRCLSRLDPPEKKAAARSDLRFGLDLCPSRSVRSQHLYQHRRQDLLFQEKMPVLHSAEADYSMGAVFCACHYCHSPMGRPLGVSSCRRRGATGRMLPSAGPPEQRPACCY